tara:strand:- start:348 stop:1628 length:1281 start_codon:yes stop_codon:yes gene_type:complete
LFESGGFCFSDYLYGVLLVSEVSVAYESSFESMNKGSKQVDEMSRMDAVDIAESRRTEAMRSYAKLPGPAAGVDVGTAVSGNDEAGPYNPMIGADGVGISDETGGRPLPQAALENRGAMGMESALDEDIRAKEFGIERGELIQSELPDAPVGLAIPDIISNRFKIIGHGSTMEMKPGRPMNKKSFAIVRDNVRDKEFTVEGGEQIPGLGRVRKITHGGDAGKGIEVLSEPGRGPGNFVLPFEGRDDDDLLMSMTDAGPGMGVMSPMIDLDSMAVEDMGSMAADMMMGGRDAFGGAVAPKPVRGLSPAQTAVLGTPLANDYLAGEELMRQEINDTTDAEMDSALMGDMGFDAMNPSIAPEVGQGLAKFAQDPRRAMRPIRYSMSTMVDDQRAHIFDVGNGRPGEVFIYFPERKDGRLGSTAEIGQMV